MGAGCSSAADAHIDTQERPARSEPACPASRVPHNRTRDVDKQFALSGSCAEGAGSTNVEVRQKTKDAGQGLVDLAVEAAKGMQTSVLHLAEGGAPEDELSSQFVTAFDLLEKGVVTVLERMGKVEERQPVEIQALVLEERSLGEYKLAEFSALGQVIISLAQQGLAAAPFGAPAAAALGVIYGRSSLAARNSQNCRTLLQLVKRCDKQLAHAFDGTARAGSLPSEEVMEGLQELQRHLLAGAERMAAYCGRGFLMRFLTSSSDEAHFAMLDANLQRAMQRTCFALAVEIMGSGFTPHAPSTYVDESRPLRRAICEAAGVPERLAPKAVQQLSSTQPQILRHLLQQHGGFTAQVIATELEALGVRVDLLESRLAAIEQRISEGGNESPGLAGYLCKWWKEAIGRLKKEAPAEAFINKLVEWFQSRSIMDHLFEYEKVLQEEGLAGLVDTAASQIRQGTGWQCLSFLYVVLLPLLDLDKNGLVTRAELRQLQLLAREFAIKKALDIPNSWPDLLDAIFIGFDRSRLRAGNSCAAQDACVAVTQALQVQRIIASYNVASLLEEYVEGTRAWMFEHVNAWLRAVLGNPSPAVAPGSTTLPTSRLMLLLAGPGMGKSVMSAAMETKLVVCTHKNSSLVQVKHFFKVGQERAQGKAMVLCLAAQLAETLPGMATLLLPVVSEHGNGSSMSMAEAFERYLLQPLHALDAQQGEKLPVVVMLLDALDEAADGNRGWEAVTSLVANQFIKLPPRVKVIATGRPQIEAAFSAWSPTWIRPEADQNQEDMRVLLRRRLQDSRLVAPRDVPAAVEIMLQKSEGQFIYVRYAFDELRGKPTWAVQELEAVLPKGLHGVYGHVMGTLQSALADERPDMLHLMRGAVLPILVAAREPLMPVQLAGLTRADRPMVDQLLRLLANLFPLSSTKAGILIHPYHKTVLDWLSNSSESGSFAVDAVHGHELLAQACYNSIMASMQHSRSSNSCSSRSSSNIMGNKNVDEAMRAAPGATIQLAAAEGNALAVPGTASSSEAAAVLLYALRHGIAHMCMAHRVQLLEEVALEFVGLWIKAYAAGFGVKVLQDLMAMGPQHTSAAVRDVVRWLRTTSSYLAQHPEAALQLACDAPRRTLVSQHAMLSPHKPQARLLTKEDNWDACLATLQHPTTVFGVDVCPEGTSCVSCSGDGIVRVWDMGTGQLRMVLEGHTGSVFCVSISPDGCTCVSGSRDKTLRVWDLRTGQLKATLEGHSADVNSVAYSPDGRTCASGADDCTVRLWDVGSSTLKTVLEGHADWVKCVAISRDGRLCASGSRDKTVRLWDVHTGQTRAVLEGHRDRVYTVAFSPDGRTCVSGSKDKTVRQWETTTGRLVVTMEGHSGDVNSAVFSLDGLTCVSGSDDKTVRLWDAGTGAPKSTLEGHAAWVKSVAVCSNSRNCVSSSRDGTVKLWEMGAGQHRMMREGHAEPVTSTATAPDCWTCVSASKDKTLRVWDMGTGQLRMVLEGHTGWVFCVSISPDGCTCVSGSRDKTLRVWDLRTGQLKATLEGHSADVNSVAYSPDGRTCASGADDCTVRLWDVGSSTLKTVLEGHADWVKCVAISRDGRMCASGSRDKTVRLRDLHTGQTRAVLEGHRDRVYTVAFSPDGRTCVSGSDDKAVKVWDVETGMLLSTLEGGQATQQLEEVRSRSCHGSASPAKASPEGTVIYWLMLEGEPEATSDSLPSFDSSSSCQSPRIGGQESATGGRKQRATIFLLPPLRVTQGPFASHGMPYVVRFFGPSGALVKYELTQ